MKFGETFEQTVRREVKEEFCVNIEKLTYVDVSNLLRKHHSRRTHWVAIVFACLINPKKVKNGNPEKITEIGWFYPDKLPEPLHSMYLPHLNFVKKAGIL